MLDSGGWSLVVAGGQDKIALAVQESSGVSGSLGTQYVASGVKRLRLESLTQNVGLHEQKRTYLGRQ